MTETIAGTMNTVSKKGDLVEEEMEEELPIAAEEVSTETEMDHQDRTTRNEVVSEANGAIVVRG